MNRKVSKKLAAMAIAVVMLLSFIAAPVPVYGRIPLAGSGTAADPYRVYTAEDFRHVGEARSPRYFVLLNDITVDFTINRYGTFVGNFNGNGHTIHLVNMPDNFRGLFDFIMRGGVVGNVHVTGTVTINRRNGHIGGLTGRNSGTIFNSSSSVNITVPTDGTTNNVGGLVGINHEHGIIVNSYASGDITGASDIGGLVGHNLGTIINSAASGNVGGHTHVGSLVGRNGRSYSGRSYGDPIGAIYQSYATGNVVFVDGRDPTRSGAIREPVGVGGMVGSNFGTISDEPPIWDFIAETPTSRYQRPEPSEESQRFFAARAMHNYRSRVGWDAQDLRGAFGERELTDIELDVLNRALKRSAQLLLSNHLDQVGWNDFEEAFDNLAEAFGEGPLTDIQREVLADFQENREQLTRQRAAREAARAAARAEWEAEWAAAIEAREAEWAAQMCCDNFSWQNLDRCGCEREPEIYDYWTDWDDLDRSVNQDNHWLNLGYYDSGVTAGIEWGAIYSALVGEEFIPGWVPAPIARMLANGIADFTLDWAEAIAAEQSWFNNFVAGFFGSLRSR